MKPELEKRVEAVFDCMAKEYKDAADDDLLISCYDKEIYGPYIAFRLKVGDAIEGMEKAEGGAEANGQHGFAAGVRMARKQIEHNLSELEEEK